MAHTICRQQLLEAPMLKVVGIHGVKSPCFAQHEPMWRHFAQSFLEIFVGVTFSRPCSEYSACEYKIIDAYVDLIVHEYDTGDDLILLGHSMGGIVACAAAKRMTKSTVRGIITVFSPHRFLWFSEKIVGESYETLPCSIVTFGAWFDHLVLCGSEHPQSLLHQTLCTDHVWGLVSQYDLARYITRTSLKALKMT